MWKGKPVIGSETGGITLQIMYGQTGYTANTVEGTAFYARYPEQSGDRPGNGATRSGAREAKLFDHPSSGRLSVLDHSDGKSISQTAHIVADPHANQVKGTAFPASLATIIIERVSPELDGGRYPVKREVADRFEVSADIFKEGHEVLMAVLRHRAWSESAWQKIRSSPWTTIDGRDGST